MQMQEES